MAVTIAVANHKGGVGKTTSVINIGACLAALGRRVLAVDLDHQCNLTTNLGFDPAEISQDRTSYGLIMGTGQLEGAVAPAGPNLAIVPGHIQLAEVDIELSKTTVLNRESRLQRALASSTAEYILLDTPPALGMPTMNALCAADVVVIAVQTYSWAYEAIKRLMLIVHEVQSQANPNLVIYALPTLHRTNVNIQRDTLAQIEATFGDLMLPTIRHSATLAEAAAAKQTIVDYANGSRAHKDHEAVAEEIIRRVERAEPQAVEA